MDSVRAWWDWCSESFGHMFLGVTAPVLLIAAFAIVLLASGSDSSLPQPPQSDVAGVCREVAKGPGQTAPCDSSRSLDGIVIDTATPVPPTPTPAPRTYIVQAGETLSVICAVESPDLAASACVDAVVELNGLRGPDQIAEGQPLLLPTGLTSSAGQMPRRTPTPAPTAEAPAEAEPTPNEQTDPDTEPTPAAEPVIGAVLTPVEQPAGEQQQAAVDANATPEESAVADGALVPLLGDLDLSPDDSTVPVYDLSEAHLYVVQPGESVLSICFEQYPTMPAQECVRLIVALNELSGSEEIYAHQGIMLP